LAGEEKASWRQVSARAMKIAPVRTTATKDLRWSSNVQRAAALSIKANKGHSTLFRKVERPPFSHDQLEETIDEDFPLWDVIEKFDREQNFTEELSAHKARQAEESADSQWPPQSEASSPKNATQ
jgi:hypothetical protein